jgi:hypothetical protein
MRILLAKHGRGFMPADEEADDLHRRLGVGELAVVKVLRIRSLPWHRMYFGICRHIGKNQDPPRDENSIDKELRIRAGHYDVMQIHGVEGVEVRVPKHINFDSMEADKWAEYWKKAELAICEHYGPEYIRERAA